MGRFKIYDEGSDETWTCHGNTWTYEDNSTDDHMMSVMFRGSGSTEHVKFTFGYDNGSVYMNKWFQTGVGSADNEFDQQNTGMTNGQGFHFTTFNRDPNTSPLPPYTDEGNNHVGKDRYGNPSAADYDYVDGNSSQYPKFQLYRDGVEGGAGTGIRPLYYLIVGNGAD